MKYAAFLRGVNVGGVLVKMAELKGILGKVGLKKVQTILASGNVVFESNKKASELKKIIESALKTQWKRDIVVVVHSIDNIKKLHAANPFEGIKVTPNTRLYVTFLFEKPKSHLKTSSKFFRILKTSDSAVCSVLTLTPNKGTVDLMGDLTKHYGKNITTRNWNTIEKILKVAG